MSEPGGDRMTELLLLLLLLLLVWWWCWDFKLEDQVSARPPKVPARHKLEDQVSARPPKVPARHELEDQVPARPPKVPHHELEDQVPARPSKVPHHKLEDQVPARPPKARSLPSTFPAESEVVFAQGESNNQRFLRDLLSHGSHAGWFRTGLECDQSFIHEIEHCGVSAIYILQAEYSRLNKDFLGQFNADRCPSLTHVLLTHSSGLSDSTVADWLRNRFAHSCRPLMYLDVDTCCAPYLEVVRAACEGAVQSIRIGSNQGLSESCMEEVAALQKNGKANVLIDGSRLLPSDHSAGRYLRQAERVTAELSSFKQIMAQNEWFCDRDNITIRLYCHGHHYRTARQEKDS